MGSGVISGWYFFLWVMAGIWFVPMTVFTVARLFRVELTCLLELKMLHAFARLLAKPAVYAFFLFCCVDVVASVIIALSLQVRFWHFEAWIVWQWLIIPLSTGLAVVFYYSAGGQRLMLPVCKKISLTFDGNNTIALHVSKSSVHKGNGAEVFFSLRGVVEAIRKTGTSTELRIGTWLFATDLAPANLPALKAHLEAIAKHGAVWPCTCSAVKRAPCRCSGLRTLSRGLVSCLYFPVRVVYALKHRAGVRECLAKLGPPPVAPVGPLRRLVNQSLKPFNATSTYEKLSVYVLLVLVVMFPDKVGGMTGYKAEVVVP